MLKSILNLEGVQVLSKGEQKQIKGGFACCDPIATCCMPWGLNNGGCYPNGSPRSCLGMGGTCRCTTGCYWCYTDYSYCGCA